MGLHTGRYVLTKNLIKKIAGTGGSSPTPSGDSNVEVLRVLVSDDTFVAGTPYTTTQKIDTNKDIHLISFYRTVNDYPFELSTVVMYSNKETSVILKGNSFYTTETKIQLFKDTASVDENNFIVYKRDNFNTEQAYHITDAVFTPEEMTSGETKFLTRSWNPYAKEIINVVVHDGLYSFCIAEFANIIYDENFANDATGYTNHHRYVTYKGQGYDIEIIATGPSSFSCSITPVSNS